MSVYTLIEPAQLLPLLADYGLGAIVALEPIQGGIENSNYFLTVEAEGGPRQLVLTLFEELDPVSAAFLPPLLVHLHGAGVPVAAPLATQAGQYQPLFLGKAVQIAPRLAGRHADAPGPRQCEAMGRALASLHLALKDYPLHRANTHGADWWQEVAARWQPQMGLTDRLLLEKCLDDFAHACASAPDLPRGLIHGDLFRDNSLFVGDSVSAILDYSEAAEDWLLLDIAITMNDFCRAWPQLRLKRDSVRAFLHGYADVRPLLAGERQALPAFLAVAAMRFWLSRLDINARNAAEGRGGEHVLEKDPLEMRDMLADRLSLRAGDFGG
jgi:homoserine kinase type II